jgi:hypothetical protein
MPDARTAFFTAPAKRFRDMVPAHDELTLSRFSARITRDS